MAFVERNAAYDLSAFDEEKINIELTLKSQDNKIIELDEKAEVKPRLSPLSVFMTSVVSLLVLMAVVAIIHGQAQLTELNQEINDAETQLTELQSYYTQLEMKVDAKLSPSEVEDYAKNVLGMSKTESYQKEFISLSEGDKAVVVNEEEKGFFQTLADAISSIWSD